MTPWWQQWVRQPQQLRLRKAIFQIHLWTGLAIGLYIVVLSLTGSVLVYRDELMRAFETPAPAFEPGRKPLSRAALTASAQRDYPDYTVSRVGNRLNRRRPVIEIWVDRASDGDHKERLFNPYTGQDLGDALPAGVRDVLWLADLHDELLGGERGRFINGLLSLLMTLLCLTGASVWWPGARNWRRSLGVRWRASWTRVNWDLHSALGAWLFLMLLLWAVTGVYLAIPEPFAAFVDRISDPDAILGDRPGDVVLRWLTQLHFGRWRSLPLKTVWAAMGLVPALMFVTGVVMWWHRVIRRRARAGD